MSIDDGVRWKTYSSFAFAARFGMMHGGCARADDADDFVAEVLEVRPGVIVVPAGRVERVALGTSPCPAIFASFGFEQSAVGADHEPRRHRVAAIGRDAPQLVVSCQTVELTVVWNTASSYRS